MPSGTHPRVITTPAVIPPSLDKAAVIHRLQMSQLNYSGGGCYHRLSGEELWREYLEEHGLTPEEAEARSNTQPTAAEPSSQEAGEAAAAEPATGKEITAAELVAEVEDLDDDRSDSISNSLPCEVCASGSDEASMLVCDCCNRGYHTYCLKPAMFVVPQEAWYCGNCGGDTQISMEAVDIIDDKNVLKHLIDGPQAHWSLSEKKRTSKRAKNYFVDESHGLYRKATTSHSKYYPARPVLGHDARVKAVKSCHELSHCGVMRTAALVAERYYWGGIVEDCREFIRGCHQCKLQSARFSEPQQLHSIPVTDQSFHCIGIDLVGPLQVSASNNKYIIVAMDYLTKWPEVLAVPDKTAQRVGDFFMEHIIARHGCPHTVLSDNGSEFQ